MGASPLPSVTKASHDVEPLSMFPDEFPPLPTKEKPPFKLTEHHETVIEALHRYGPMDERAIFEKAFLGVLTTKSVYDLVDRLARNGYLVDTGERGDWTKKGRRIVWTLPS